MISQQSSVVVTGAAGFIGSHLVEALNALGFERIIAVDDLSDGRKFSNLVSSKILDFVDKNEFLQWTEKGEHPIWSEVSQVFHQGACSDTTEWDGRYMLQENLRFSQSLFQRCVVAGIPFFYASSAAIYGKNHQATVAPENEHPLNVYGYSKLLFDQYVRRQLPQVSSPVIGLRYFNVFGAREEHKKHMKSVVAHFYHALQETGEISIFTAAGIGPGEQARDFIYVKDVVDVNLWCMQNTLENGIYNCGTGKAMTFNRVAEALIDHYKSGAITYTPMPEHLNEAYQFFTEADMTPLRQQGYDKAFMTMTEALADYLPVCTAPGA
jgi:ADP-L-glycero-D-manno-heptose 6-epimerase